MAIAVLTLSGCAGWWSSGNGLEEGSVVSGGGTRFTGVAESFGEVPFSLEILDEVNDGRELYLRARLSSQAAWDPSQVVIRLLGFDAGLLMQESSFLLSELMKSDDLGIRAKVGSSPTQDLVFTLSMNVHDISDYQVEVLWGEDALPFLQKEEETSGLLVLRNLTIDRKDGDPCVDSQCAVSYRITGELLNAGETVINKAVLGLGYQLGEEEAAAPQDEELVEVAGLALSPGMVRAVEVDVDKSFEKGQAQNYWPVMRIISQE